MVCLTKNSLYICPRFNHFLGVKEPTNHQSVKEKINTVFVKEWLQLQEERFFPEDVQREEKNFLFHQKKVQNKMINNC